jgi:type I restriction enzyme, R subunit
MSEYDFVEKPFLNQLAALDWRVIDQGPQFPTDPAKSLRKSFREIILRDIFQQSVRAINVAEDGRPWLSEKQLEELFEQITNLPGTSLLEANENAQKLLYRTQVDMNERTGEQ